MDVEFERCGAPANIGRKDALTGAGVTIGAALVVAAIMILGRNPVTETIGLVMSPGVLVIGAQWMVVRRRSWAVKAVLIGGPFVVLFLIGLLVGLARGN